MFAYYILLPLLAIIAFRQFSVNPLKKIPQCQEADLAIIIYTTTYVLTGLPIRAGLDLDMMDRCFFLATADFVTVSLLWTLSQTRAIRIAMYAEFGLILLYTASVAWNLIDVDNIGTLAASITRYVIGNVLTFISIAALLWNWVNGGSGTNSKGKYNKGLRDSFSSLFQKLPSYSKVEKGKIKA